MNMLNKTLLMNIYFFPLFADENTLGNKHFPSSV